MQELAKQVVKVGNSIGLSERQICVIGQLNRSTFNTWKIGSVKNAIEDNELKLRNLLNIMIDFQRQTYDLRQLKQEDWIAI